LKADKHKHDLSDHRRKYSPWQKLKNLESDNDTQKGWRHDAPDFGPKSMLVEESDREEIPEYEHGQNHPSRFARWPNLSHQRNT
jgi:hypothetical protein